MLHIQSWERLHQADCTSFLKLTDVLVAKGCWPVKGMMMGLDVESPIRRWQVFPYGSHLVGTIALSYTPI